MDCFKTPGVCTPLHVDHICVYIYICICIYVFIYIYVFIAADAVCCPDINIENAVLSNI